MYMQLITMSQKEIRQLDVIQRLLRQEINGTKAAHLLSLTTRHIRRLKVKVNHQGPPGLIHGNRGKPSNRAISQKERDTISALLQQRYPDFGPTLASEKLAEVHGIVHDPKTISALQTQAGLGAPRRKRKQHPHRAWRQRKECYGELEQFDGSYHNWLESRDGTDEQCLLLAIDDATGTVPHAVFAAHEGVLPVMSFWREYILHHGKPRGIYVDKFSTYSMNQKTARENPDTKTQVQRACHALDIQPIFANSPQAKGRVERVFHTLQDRLVKELRLADIATKTDADRFLREVFLPAFNAKFSVQPATATNLHRPLTAGEKENLTSTFSRHTERTVHNDFTLAFQNAWYQLTPQQPCLVRKKERVIMEEHLDGTIHIRHRGKELNYSVLPQRPQKTKDSPWILATARQPVKPAVDHPWRTFHYGKQLTPSAK